MTPGTELPELTFSQLEVLRRFADVKAGVEEVRCALSAVFEFDLKQERRTAQSRFRVPEPGIAITRDHISNALAKEEQGLISEEELIEWATMLLLNDAYVPDPKDEDFVAEWLNRISQRFDPA